MPRFICVTDEAVEANSFAFVFVIPEQSPSAREKRYGTKVHFSMTLRNGA